MTDDPVEFEGANPDRRAFLKRLLVGTAFAAPMMASFSMGGIDSVFAGTPRSTTLASNTNTTATTTTTTEPPPATAAPRTVVAPPTPAPPTAKPSPPATNAAAVEANPNFTG